METTDNRHALLSPSSAHRWLNCTPSAMAESKYEDQESEYAKEGTLAHAVCAYGLAKRTDSPRAAYFRMELSKERGDGNIPEEMQTYAEEYVEFVLGLAKEIADAEIYIETKFDLGEWASGSFGTSDCVIVGSSTIAVVDFKYGMGVKVEAEENPQMRMYALGALDEFGLERDIDTVITAIWQPRLAHYSTETLSTAFLLEWGTEYLKPLAEVAARGLGAYQTGRWCKFCKHTGSCPELDRLAGVAYSIDIDREDAESIGRTCLPMTGPLELWISAVKSKALTLMLEGKEVPGYKVVRKRTLRKITEPDKVRDALLGNGFSSHEILKEPALKSLGELEKLVGKKQFETLCGTYVVKPEGEPTIAEDGDKRENLINNPFANIKI